MTGPCFEVVVYTLHDQAGKGVARAEAFQRIETFPGFIGSTQLSDVRNAAKCVDLVTWTTLADAQAAAHRVGNDAEFASFRSEIASVQSIGHYTQMPSSAAVPVVGNGIEIGRFRLKPGVDEGQMRLAYSAMVRGHLMRQPGWRDQRLVKLEDGMFMDLAFAENELKAREICACWRGNDLCEAFLAMVDPVSMEFGTAA